MPEQPGLPQGPALFTGLVSMLNGLMVRGGRATFSSFLNIRLVSELTIASGVVTVTGSRHTVDTQGDAGSDDLDTINGGADGDFLFLAAENSTRTVIMKDGTGNLDLAGDFSMDHAADSIMLIYRGATSAWQELGRSDNE